MALRTTVVVGNITNLSEARYCAGMGVDYLCFPSHRIDPKTYGEITSWISGPQIVLDVSLEENPLAVLANYPAEIVMITVAQAERIEVPLGKMALIDARHASKNAFVSLGKSHVKADFMIVNEGQMADFSRENGLKIIVSPYDKFFVGRLLLHQIDGIWLDGTDEEKPGLKDYSRLEEILELLEVE